MKKLIKLCFVFAIIICLAGCSQSTNKDDASQNQETNNKEQNNPDSNMQLSNSLVVCFSWSGNTKAVAQEIQSQTQATLFEITPQEPYTDDYDDLLDSAQNEQADNARPAISGTIENFDQYETVFVGYPNWWGDMPMILYTLFDQYDFSNKTIVPFVTSGGSGFSKTLDTIEKLEPHAKVLEGLSLSDSEADNSSDSVENWLQELNLGE